MPEDWENLVRLKIVIHVQSCTGGFFVKARDL